MNEKERADSTLRDLLNQTLWFKIGSSCIGKTGFFFNNNQFSDYSITAPWRASKNSVKNHLKYAIVIFL